MPSTRHPTTWHTLSFANLHFPPRPLPWPAIDPLVFLSCIETIFNSFKETKWMIATRANSLGVAVDVPGVTDKLVNLLPRLIALGRRGPGPPCCCCCDEEWIENGNGRKRREEKSSTHESAPSLPRSLLAHDTSGGASGSTSGKRRDSDVILMVICIADRQSTKGRALLRSAGKWEKGDTWERGRVRHLLGLPGSLPGVGAAFK